MDEFVDQARLPHTRLPDYGHNLTMTSPGLLQRLLQSSELLLPSYEAGEPARRAGLQAPADRTGPHQFKDLHGFCQPLDRKPPQGGDVDESLGQSEGGRGQAATARGGEVLHARRQVGGLPNGRVVHVQIIADGPDHDFSRIEPDPHQHLHPVGVADPLGIAAHGGLHGQGGVAGAHRVILVGDRRPEKRHDAVPHSLVDGAFIAVHSVHHDVQRRVQELPGLFWIQPLDQLGGALEVGKEHRHLLALAFQDSPGGEDLFDQVFGGIGARGLGLHRRGGGGGDGRRGVARPDQHGSLFVHSKPLALNEFGLQVLQIVVI
jgi:hypothetical protein